MGYYTDFSLSVIEGGRKLTDERREALQKEVDSMGAFESYGVLFPANWDKDTSADTLWGNAKWYDCDDDMLLLSYKFPELVFCVHGEGEESWDIWTHYYMAGKMQDAHVQIVQDDFSRAKILYAADAEYNPNLSDGRYSYQK